MPPTGPEPRGPLRSCDRQGSAAQRASHDQRRLERDGPVALAAQAAPIEIAGEIVGFEDAVEVLLRIVPARHAKTRIDHRIHDASDARLEWMPFASRAARNRTGSRSLKSASSIRHSRAASTSFVTAPLR